MNCNIQVHSPRLLDAPGVRDFSQNITLTFNKDLKQYFSEKFPGYYIFKVPENLVEKIYFQGFFKSQEYFDAIEKRLFSPKWETYIRSKKYKNFYILDAHDYNGEIWRYLSYSQESIEIEYFGEIFWIYHDIGHAYLQHLYTHGTYRHRDEMDASLFAVMKLLFRGDFQEGRIKTEVIAAAKDCLKSGKIINHEDIKYLFTYMDFFQKTLL